MLRAWNVRVDEGVARAVREAVVRLRQNGAWSEFHKYAYPCPFRALSLMIVIVMLATTYWPSMLWVLVVKR